MQPRVVACAPTDTTDQELYALNQAIRRAGAAAVAIVPEPLAAAIGAGLEVSSCYARSIVDIEMGLQT